MEGGLKLSELGSCSASVALGSEVAISPLLMDLCLGNNSAGGKKNNNNSNNWASVELMQNINSVSLGRLWRQRCNLEKIAHDAHSSQDTDKTKTTRPLFI